MYKEINKEIAAQLKAVIDHTPDNENMGFNLIPVAMQSAQSSSDLLSGLAAHYVATLHILSATHKKHGEMPVEDIINEVRAQVDAVVRESDDHLCTSPEFKAMVVAMAHESKQLIAAGEE